MIRALNETSARFKDLIGDHYEVGTELSRMTMPDQESQAWKKDELERRRDNIEEELRLLMQDQQRP